MLVNTRQVRKIQQQAGAYAFLLPHLIWFLGFVAFPIGYGIYMSLHVWRLIGTPRFVGLDNYVRIWQDARFWDSVINTLVFAAISVPLIVALSLLLALMLNHTVFGRLWPLVAFVSPAFFGSAGILLAWSWILNSSGTGLMNYYLRTLGVIDEPVAWLTKSPTMAWIWILVVTAWWIVGFGVLLYLGALQRIPPEQYDAAAVDGAGWWARFWHVTLPWIRNVMFFDVARNVVLAFGLFDQVLILTGGGPGGATRTMVHYLYLIGFQRQDLGRAATMAWYIFSTVVLFGAVQLALLTRSVRSAEE